MDLIIGSHVGFSSSSKTFLGSVKEALSYDSTAFMIYTSAPQNSISKPINMDEVNAGKALMNENNLELKNVIVHAPYIINLANDKNFDFNVSMLKNEIARCEEIGLKKLVLHPGSHVGLGVDTGIKNIVDSLNQALKIEDDIIILLETMAGKGSEIGSSLEELKQIYDGVNLKDKIGLCLDTCHLNDAGYDVGNFDLILDKVDNLFGKDKIGCIHINDSKNEIESHKDRHANLGEGTIGFDKLIKVIYNERLENVPKILETPYIDGQAPYKKEIEQIRKKER